MFNMGTRVASKRWHQCIAIIHRLRYSILALALVATASCTGAGDTSPSDAISTAAARSLSSDYLSATVTVSGEANRFTAVETIDVQNQRSVLEGQEQNWKIASSRAGYLLVDPTSTSLDTGGRWLEISLAESKKWAETLSDDLGDFAELFLRGGLVLNTLGGLTSPGETTLIGREVVASTATSHYLVGTRSEGLSAPVEVWISDDGWLTQLRYLTTDGDDAPVEVTVALLPGQEGDLAAFPDDGESITAEAVAEEARIEDRREADEAAEEAARRDEALAEAEEAAANPIPADDVEIDDVNEALDRRAALDELMDGVFVLDEVEQLCVGIDDFLENGVQHNIVCQRLLSSETQAAFCPAVDDFAVVLLNSSSRAQVALAAAVLEESLEGVSEQGLRTVWRSTPPEPTLELESSEVADLPILEGISGIAEFWATARALDGPSTLYVGNQYAMLTATCDTALTYDISFIEDQDVLGEVPVLETRSGQSPQDDPLRSTLPIRVGAESNDVARIQRLLLLAGGSLYPDGADGTYGPGTEAELVTFQLRNGLAGTGVVDDETLTVLRSIERASGLAATSAADPACPTLEQVRAAAVSIDAHGSPFEVTYVRCSGDWATARHLFIGNDSETEMLVAYESSEWIWRQLAMPGFACGEVPAAHRARLAC